MSLDRTPRPDLVDNGIASTHQPLMVDDVPVERPVVFFCDERQDVAANDVQHLFYDMTGKPTERTEIAVAKSVARNGVTRHYIRVGTDGMARNLFVDPRGIYFKPDDLVRTNPYAGTAYYEYQAVTDDVMRDYLAFLRNGNTTLLRRAQRDFHNHG